jgi:hypothetical protein
MSEAMDEHDRLRELAFSQPTRDGKIISFRDHEAEWEIKYKTAMNEAGKKIWPDTYEQI